MREYIIDLIFLIIVAIAAFGWGMVYESRRTDSLWKHAISNQEAIRYLLGEEAIIYKNPSKRK